MVKRYNLFSRGGCLPPMWKFGFKYRVKGDVTQNSAIRFADYFRNSDIPCNVSGLEPGWQTVTYSCSYIWNKARFPQHKEMPTRLQEKGYKMNLWKHAYVHPTSPARKVSGTISTPIKSTKATVNMRQRPSFINYRFTYIRERYYLLPNLFLV